MKLTQWNVQYINILGKYNLSTIYYKNEWNILVQYHIENIIRGITKGGNINNLNYLYTRNGI